MLATVADGYTPIGLQDAVVPFISPYRPIWLGLGAIAFDLLLALVATSLLRERIGYRIWRYVHWLAYASWPVALVHALGTGSDARLGWMRWTGVACVAVVAFAVMARAALTPDAPRPLRAGRDARGAASFRLRSSSGTSPVRRSTAGRGARARPLRCSQAGKRAVRASRPPAASIGRASALPVLVLAERNAATDEPAGRPRRRRHPRPAARRRRRIGADRPARAAAERWRVDDRERRLVCAGAAREPSTSAASPASTDTRVFADVGRARWPTAPALLRSEHRRSAQRGHRVDVGHSERNRRMSASAARSTVEAPAGVSASARRRAPGRTSRLGGGALALYGPLPRSGSELIAELQLSGLRGRGGGAFPTGDKFAAVAAESGRPVVVVNATEGEPASSKDRALVRSRPPSRARRRRGCRKRSRRSHGRRCTGSAWGSCRARHSQCRASGAAGEARLADRVDPGRVRLRRGDGSRQRAQFGKAGKPSVKPPYPFERGVGGAPTLVQNAETLAHVALIARFGSAWFRSLGTEAEPGTALVSVSGSVARPGVYEVELGTRISEVIAESGGVTEPISASLVGGYFGGWTRDPNQRLTAGRWARSRRHRRLSEERLRRSRERACDAVSRR